MRKRKSNGRTSSFGNIIKVKKALDTGFLLSIGIASIAKENAKKIVGEIVRKGNINEKQGRGLVSDLLKRSRKERERVRKLFMR